VVKGSSVIWRVALSVVAPGGHLGTGVAGAGMSAVRPAGLDAFGENRTSPPMSAEEAFISLGILVLGFTVLCVMSWRRRRFEAPLRAAARARQAQTFSMSVDAKVSRQGVELPVKGRLQLVVWGDIVEVSHPFPLARFIFGQEYFFLARETTVRLIPGRQDWILIEGHWRGRTTRVWVARRDMTREIWNALIYAGASPGGPLEPSTWTAPTA
jgi:hypothetical protein